MGTIDIATSIAASPERCFDLARDIDAHIASARGTEERAIGARTHGLLGLGDEVTWEARHFGVPLRMTVRVTRFDRPRSFEDEMVRGPFRSMRHRHEFTPLGGGTMMRDLFEFTAPFGVLGWLAERLVLDGYMRRFLRRRATALKAMAER